MPSQSVKQYKRRLSRWRLDKNVKLEEMAAILLAKDHRKGQGKESVFFVRRQQVNGKKILRYRRLLADTHKLRQYSQTVVDKYFERILTGRDQSQDIRCFTPIPDDPNLDKGDATLANDPEINIGDFPSVSQGLKRESAFSQESGGWCCPHHNCTEYAFDRFGDLEVHFADHYRSPESRQEDNHPAPSMLNQVTGWTSYNQSSDISFETWQHWNPFGEGP